MSQKHCHDATGGGGLVPHISQNNMEATMQKNINRIRTAESALDWYQDDFPGGDFVCVAFKSLGTRKQEHPLNTWACKMTTFPGELAPAGRMCHTELMMQVSPGNWYRFSINKKSCKIGPDGKQTWLKGRVHGKLVGPESMVKYHYYVLPVSRDKQVTMFKFLQAQHNADFNLYGYVLNFFFPWIFNIGTRRWIPQLQHVKRKWFCTELVCTALQSIGYCGDLIACCQSPNSLNRVCSTIPGVIGSCNPISVCFKV